TVLFDSPLTTAESGFIREMLQTVASNCCRRQPYCYSLTCFIIRFQQQSILGLD
ncbi:MAG: hypothetical protein J07HR59_00756, partial [Halorubrum sp. J07HR59]